MGAQVLHVLQAAPQLVALLQSTEASLDSCQNSPGASQPQVQPVMHSSVAGCIGSAASWDVLLAVQMPCLMARALAFACQESWCCAQPGMQALSTQGAYATFVPFLAEQRASWCSYATGTPPPQQARTWARPGPSRILAPVLAPSTQQAESVAGSQQSSPSPWCTLLRTSMHACSQLALCVGCRPACMPAGCPGSKQCC